jgi:hypothetical protein
MEGTWNTDARVIRTCEVSYERPESNKPLERPRNRCEVNIKMLVKGISMWRADCTSLA